MPWLQSFRRNTGKPSIVGTSYTKINEEKGTVSALSSKFIAGGQSTETPSTKERKSKFSGIKKFFNRMCVFFLRASTKPAGSTGPVATKATELTQPTKLTPAEEKNLQAICDITIQYVKDGDTAGLLRVTPNSGKLKELLGRLGKGEIKVDEYDKHILASVIKERIGKFSPITEELFTQMQDEPSKSASILNEAITKMEKDDEAKGKIFRTLINTLAYCYKNASDSSNEEFNKSVPPVAIGPQLFSKCNLTIDNSPLCSKLAKNLLENWEIKNSSNQLEKQEPSTTRPVEKPTEQFIDTLIGRLSRSGQPALQAEPQKVVHNKENIDITESAPTVEGPIIPEFENIKYNARMYLTSIQEYQEIIKEKKKYIEEKQAEILTKNLSEDESTIDDQKKEMQNIHESITRNVKEMENIKTEIEKSEKKARSFMNEKKDVSKDIIDRHIANAKGSLDRIRTLFSENEEKYKKLHSIENKVNTRLTELRLGNSLRNRIKTIMDGFEKIKHDATKHSTSIQTKQKSFTEEIKKIEQKRKKIEQKKIESEKKLENQLEAIEQEDKKLEELGSEERIKRLLASTLSRNTSTIDKELTTIDEELTTIDNELKERQKLLIIATNEDKKIESVMKKIKEFEKIAELLITDEGIDHVAKADRSLAEIHELLEKHKKNYAAPAA